MSKVLVTESNLQNIADAIRTKNGSSDTYTPAEMSNAIENIPSGGGDISEYFDDEVKEYTTSLNTIVMQILKKLPPINISSNITILSYAFSDFRGETLPLFTVGNYVDNTQYMFNKCLALKTIPLFNTSKVTNASYMFSSCKSLETIPLFDFSNVTSMSTMFSNCLALKTVPLFDTGKVTSMNNMFSNCLALKTIPLFNTSNVTNLSSFFYVSNQQQFTYMALESVPKLNCNKITSISNIFYSNWRVNGQHSAFDNLTYLGGFENLGMSYSTTMGANSFQYGLDLSDCYYLTHDSLMNVINNLYDIATKGCNAQKIILGSINLAKLSAAEIQIATNKGWTVS